MIRVDVAALNRQKVVDELADEIDRYCEIKGNLFHEDFVWIWKGLAERLIDNGWRKPSE